jgi:hypothetical protein
MPGLILFLDHRYKGIFQRGDDLLDAVENYSLRGEDAGDLIFDPGGKAGDVEDQAVLTDIGDSSDFVQQLFRPGGIIAFDLEFPAYSP